ncbi:MAG TPA: hypothetical protein VMH80_20150 [Bryobacteraceae bacterium]|nr:hypothetical protein [Bryobacteraceae bacterium]
MWRLRIALLVPFIVYLLFPTRNYYWDGVAFAIDIEKNLPAGALVHPNHLIYKLCGAALYGLGGGHIRALYLMQALNCLLAGFAVVLLYLALRKSGWSREHGLVAAWIFGFSATWWKFATDANAYVPSIFLLLCAYLLIENPRTAVFAGLAHAGAMLFHELAILFLPVAILLLWKRRALVAAYCTEALAPVAAAYWWAYRAAVAGGATGGFWVWMTSHSPDSGFSFRLLRNVGYTLRGTLRLFFGGRLPDFVRNPLSIAAGVLLAFALVALLVYGWRAVPVRWSRPPWHLLVWAGVYVAFLFFWMPQNTFYRLFYLAPLVLIAGAMFEDTRKNHLAGFALAAVMLLWNFTFLTYPESRVQFNAPLRFALAQHDAWPPGSAIVFHTFHPDLWTISYFNQQAAWMSLERPDLGQMQRDLDYAHSQKQPLWVEQTAYELVDATPQGRQWLMEHERPGELVRFRDEKHEFVFHSMR